MQKWSWRRAPVSRANARLVDHRALHVDALRREAQRHLRRRQQAAREREQPRPAAARARRSAATRRTGVAQPPRTGRTRSTRRRAPRRCGASRRTRAREGVAGGRGEAPTAASSPGSSEGATCARPAPRDGPSVSARSCPGTSTVSAWHRLDHDLGGGARFHSPSVS